MNILDENIPKNQRQLLESWRIPVRQIGVNFGLRGLQDDEIIPLLLKQDRPTFFTRDEDFYERRLCHASTAWFTLQQTSTRWQSLCVVCSAIPNSIHRPSGWGR